MSPGGPRARELTPRGSGGVSVIEIAGPGARSAASELARVDLEPGRLRLVRLAAAAEGGEETLDEALAWCESDERVELHVHGSPPLVRRVLEQLGGGAGGATPPTTLEERALELLARAPCEAAARILLDQAEGALRRELEAWRAADDCEALERARRVAARSRIARFALEPPLVVLAGPVNSGKSTLFNLLFGRERVVVSPSEGTTRDAVIEPASFGEWPVRLADTAGERELVLGRAGRDAAVAEIEREGQRLARELRERADLVLWCRSADASDDGTDSPPPRTLVVRTRADLAGAASPGRAPRLSALRAPEEAVETVHRAFRDALGLPERVWTSGEGLAFDAASRDGVDDILARLEAGNRGRALAAITLLEGGERFA